MALRSLSLSLSSLMIASPKLSHLQWLFFFLSGGRHNSSITLTNKLPSSLLVVVVLSRPSSSSEAGYGMHVGLPIF